ncbi:1-phosphofructokinase family hexose kinase [Mesotoga sp. B105.6.4]|uniref:1-phosphofructokinase family hexose kinase n=2 Tax=Mesotoga TaxID=1184396 RepID=UPI002155EC79|nr:1-phosphofructokinase family hexose kinase [Mesotoga sp. B105.6.4]
MMIFSLTLNAALDRFLYTERLTEDDTVRVERVKDYPAGKGVDVSRVVNELGGHSVSIAFLGGHTGKIVEEMLDEEGVVYATVRSDKETRTNILIETKKGQYRLSLPGPVISNREVDKLFKTVDILLRKDDYLLLCGSVPEGVSNDIYRQLCSRMRGIGVNVYIDSDKEPFSEGVKAGPKGIKPNTHELQRLLKRDLKGESDLRRAVQEVSEKYSIEEVLLTMGGKGALALLSGSLYRINVPEVPVKSAVGAGDSFLAAYCMSRELGETAEVALKMAGAASSAAVMTPGTELCKYNDVIELLPRIEVKRL